ncbi:hypothetical protein QJS04_geneDACA001125 [Acorus gramineus]|uniref:Uncharacterized protein n=1 Tax=Acorus gramineus TaxID=55184 RepID=A0AAV9AAZ3_ACOGR|nr:hypothetical protein QJS04_geneDACA001125 [Acorus gramineus]
MVDHACFPFTSLFRRLRFRRRSPPLSQPSSASKAFNTVPTSTTSAKDLRPRPVPADCMALLLSNMFCDACRVYRERYLGLQEGDCQKTMVELCEMMSLYLFITEYRGGIGVHPTMEFTGIKRMHEAMNENLYCGEGETPPSFDEDWTPAEGFRRWAASQHQLGRIPTPPAACPER